MNTRVLIVLVILGLLLSPSVAGWGQSQPQNDLQIIKQYQSNLQNIPPNLPPEQKNFLEQQFKRQMILKRLELKASQAQKAYQPQKPSPPKETTKNP
jgi:predicted PurR-regulated permease PerM